MICEKCSNNYIVRYGSGRFCSRSCANSRVRTAESKKKTSATLMGHTNTPSHLYEKVCVVCKNSFEVSGRKKHRSTCSSACAKSRQIEVARSRGRNSAAKQQRRSKNEIAFADLCKSKFESVRLNEPIFNGWDADVILNNQKIAILWNGPWHYHKITEKHSLEQVQNRDRIKLAEIAKAGYKSYIIKDMGSHDIGFVNSEFEKFLRWIS